MAHDKEGDRDKATCREYSPARGGASAVIRIFKAWRATRKAPDSVLESQMESSKLAQMEELPNVQPLAKPTWKEKLAEWKRYWTSKDGWIGDYVFPFAYL
jgi:hypothetical protein